MGIFYRSESSIIILCSEKSTMGYNPVCIEITESIPDANRLSNTIS